MDRRSPNRLTVNVGSFRNDPLYPRIVHAVARILDEGKVVAPVDVLVRVGLLAPEQLDDWRRGRVPYLERVIHSNLTRLPRLLRILQFHAHDLNLVPSGSVYIRCGKGPKQRLRFTKTGEPKLEEAYARHFVWPGKGPFHPPAPKERTADNDGRASTRCAATPWEIRGSIALRSGSGSTGGNGPGELDGGCAQCKSLSSMNGTCVEA